VPLVRSRPAQRLAILAPEWLNLEPFNPLQRRPRWLASYLADRALARAG